MKTTNHSDDGNTTITQKGLLLNALSCLIEHSSSSSSLLARVNTHLCHDGFVHPTTRLEMVQFLRVLVLETDIDVTEYACEWISRLPTLDSNDFDYCLETEILRLALDIIPPLSPLPATSSPVDYLVRPASSTNSDVDVISTYLVTYAPNVISLALTVLSSTSTSSLSSPIGYFIGMSSNPSNASASLPYLQQWILLFVRWCPFIRRDHLHTLPSFRELFLLLHQQPPPNIDGAYVRKSVFSLLAEDDDILIEFLHAMLPQSPPTWLLPSWLTDAFFCPPLCFAEFCRVIDYDPLVIIDFLASDGIKSTPTFIR
jgi:hypothetical protein